MSDPKGAVESIHGWSLQCEGVGGSRVGIVLISLEGIKLDKSLRLGFQAPNNEAEYEALIVGLKAMKCLGVKEVEMYSDLILVVSQIKGSFKARDHCMLQYLQMFKSLRPDFQKVSVVRVSRSQNSHVDSLVRGQEYINPL